jgi:hypothetical protein
MKEATKTIYFRRHHSFAQIIPSNIARKLIS